MNEKLLNELVSAGLLDSKAADEIKKEASNSNLSIEEAIYKKDLLKEEDVVKVKAKILGIPFKKIDPESIDSKVLNLFSADTARTYRVFPIEKKDDLLVVAAENPTDQKTQSALRFIAKDKKVNLGVYMVTPSTIDAVIKKYSPFQGEINAAVAALNVRSTSINRPKHGIVMLEGDRTVVAGEAPVIKIVAEFLKEAVHKKASDIHFEPQRTRLRVRLRVDGELKESSSVPIEIHSQIISRIKIISKLKIDENRVPQDGRFRTEIEGREIDFRVATFPTPFGEKVALRVLDPSTGLKGLPDLGVSGTNLKLLEDGIKEPYGSILVTGPTGSGKTTTLYALMQILNKENTNIVSLEDPVEYSMQGVNQSQVKPEIGYTFASGLRQILRQDPDVIMVGEIRDNETAELATHAALTGHIVLSTLHTNSSLGVIPRLIDLGVPAFLLSSTINLMVAQRLIGKLCQKCKKKQTNIDSQVLEEVKREVAGLPDEFKSKYENNISIFRAAGCQSCNGKGNNGRVALMEVFKMTPELSEVISQGVSENRLLEESRRQKLLTMRQDGIIKALEGLVAIEEVLRETADS